MAVNKEGMAYRIAGEYKTMGDAVEFGSVVIDGRPYSECRVRAGLSTLTKHGVVVGATGGGKTRTLQSIAEQLSDAGVPVVMADVKGDLQGLAQRGFRTDEIVDRAIGSGCDSWNPQSFPVEFASLGSEGIGVPIRASAESFGPLLLAKALGLNGTQESMLRRVFRYATVPLNTLDDLREAIEEADFKYTSTATMEVIARNIEDLEDDGGRTFFGTPSFDPADLMRITDDPEPRGVITLFEMADDSMQLRMFSIFMMWMLGKLGEILPEVGAVDKPRLVIIFEEAHLMFDGASKAFLELIIKTARLVRSKGIGLIFCSQSPESIHKEVMKQMGFRLLHALQERAEVTAAIGAFLKTDIYNLQEEVLALETGEAMITVRTERGGKTPAARTMIRPPRSHMGTIGFNAVRRVVQASELFGKYHVEPEPERESADDVAALPPITLNLRPSRPPTFEELLAMTERDISRSEGE